MKPVLHSYFRSSAAYRVRIALNLKGIDYELHPVHLLRDGGQQRSEGFLRINPQGLVPVLTDGDLQIAQSLAIMEYLEEKDTRIPLLPQDAGQRAKVRQFSLAIACDIHPLNNLRVLSYLTAELGVTDEARMEWIRHWIGSGLRALEQQLASAAVRSKFCFGDSPTIADCCLVPQLFNARRFGVSMDEFPLLTEVDKACAELEAFKRAHPDVQPDAE